MSLSQNDTLKSVMGETGVPGSTGAEGQGASGAEGQGASGAAGQGAVGAGGC